MLSRRDLLQLTAATVALLPLGVGDARAQGRPTQDELLRFENLGNVTLVHMADLHAQLVPVFFREAETNLGVGRAGGDAIEIDEGVAGHVRYVPLRLADAYALSAHDFASLARRYGRL